jgi:hypothetical protein
MYILIRRYRKLTKKKKILPRPITASQPLTASQSKPGKHGTRKPITGAKTKPRVAVVRKGASKSVPKLASVPVNDGARQTDLGHLLENVTTSLLKVETSLQEQNTFTHQLKEQVVVVCSDISTCGVELKDVHDAILVLKGNIAEVTHIAKPGVSVLKKEVHSIQEKLRNNNNAIIKLQLALQESIVNANSTALVTKSNTQAVRSVAQMTEQIKTMKAQADHKFKNLQEKYENLSKIISMQCDNDLEWCKGQAIEDVKVYDSMSRTDVIDGVVIPKDTIATLYYPMCHDDSSNVWVKYKFVDPLNASLSVGYVPLWGKVQSNKFKPYFHRFSR